MRRIRFSLHRELTRWLRGREFALGDVMEKASMGARLWPPKRIFMS